MASLSSPTTLLILLLFLHFSISISTASSASRSHKVQNFRGRRSLAAAEEEEEEQPLPKPKKKPLADSKSSKSELFTTRKIKPSIAEEAEDEKPLPKPKKKPMLDSTSSKSEISATKKSKTSIDDVEEAPKPKKKPILETKSPKPEFSVTKNSKASTDDDDEEPKSKKKHILDTKSSKKSLVTLDEEEGKPMPKPKKKPISQAELSATTKKSSKASSEEDDDQPLPKPNKKSILNTKNQTTTTTKTKKTNSTSSTTSTISPKTQLKITSGSATSAKVSKAKAKAKAEPVLSWLDDEMDDQDLIAEFGDLPSRLLPDLEKISTTSQAYLRKYKKEIAEGVKPFVGKKYAPTIASLASFLFLILPLLLVIAVFQHLKTYLSLQRVLIFIQAYLAIYFATLSITAMATGLEPLRFFYATAPETYAWTQAVQTLGYVLYLIVQLVNLVVVFSAPPGEVTGGARALALAQMVVGLAVGLHYYAAVFHRAVAGEAPRANWKVHGIYAVCFLVICGFARAERRKKAYLQDDGDYGKKS